MRYLIFLLSFCTAQYTLTHDGITREYYVFYPDNPPASCPLIINIHNFNGDALFLREYTEMDDFALPANIAVVYPESKNSHSRYG